jgi:hypothetical protein
MVTTRRSLTGRREPVLVPITAPTFRTGPVGDKGECQPTKLDDERFLIGGLDSLGTVVGADPSDRLVSRIPGQDRKAGQAH